MAFHLQPATVDDAPVIADIFRKAFAANLIMNRFYPDTPKELVIEKDLKMFTKKIGEGTIYGERFTKLVEESTGKVVAFSAWQYPYHLTPEQKATKDEEAKANRAVPPPPGSQVALIEDFYRQLFAGREKWIVPEKTFFLHILAVLPEYQGKGLGSILIKPGLEEADKAGAQTYIEASSAGLPVYLRYGWKEVDAMVIDMRPYGGDGVEHQGLLMREPHAPKLTGR